MQTISFVSASGGAGKTLLSILTAGALAIKGKKVLFLDLDPSASATLYLLDDYVEDCNLKTLMKDLVDKSLGRAKKELNVESCLHRHKVLGAERASFDLLPGGNLEDIRSDIQNVSNWRDLLEMLVNPLRDHYDYAIVDAPNWVFPLFPMTVNLSSYYIVMSRPGPSEITKTKVFLERIFLIMKNQFGIDQPQLHAFVVLNQFRSNMHAEEVEREGKRAYEELMRAFYGIKTAHLEERKNYYGNKPSEFWGFKYLEDFRIDSYKEKGHILARREGPPTLQFRAYMDALDKFLEEVTPYSVKRE
ncbi:MAG: ParA family protein [Thermoproteus sp.]